MPELSGITYEAHPVDSSFSAYRCAWDDRFALADAISKSNRNLGEHASIAIAGESLQSVEDDIPIYKTAVLWLKVSRKKPVDPKPSKVYLAVLNSINWKPSIYENCIVKNGKLIVNGMTVAVDCESLDPEPNQETWRDRKSLL